MSFTEQQAASLLDFSQPLDLPTLEVLVTLMYQAGNPLVRFLD
jgi:hypothetical protein